jgi:hypothetical protein
MIIATTRVTPGQAIAMGRWTRLTCDQPGCEEWVVVIGPMSRPGRITDEVEGHEDYHDEPPPSVHSLELHRKRRATPR